MRLRFRKVPPAPPVGSGYRVAAARGRADPNAAGPGRRRAGCGGVAGRAPGPARPPLTWSAQVGPGRGAGLARRRGIRPRPCRRRRRELTWETRRGRGASAASSPGNAGGPAGRQEAAAAEELNRTAHASPSHPSRPRRHLHLAPGWRAAPPAGHRFPPPALPTCQVSRLGAGGDPEIRERDRLRDGPPKLPAAGWTRSRERVSVAPLREREKPAGTRVTPVADAPRQSRGQGSSPSALPGPKVPLTPGWSSGRRISGGGAAQGSPTWVSRLPARSRVPSGAKPATGRVVAVPGNFPRQPPDSPRLETAAAPSHLYAFRMVWKALGGRDAGIRALYFPGALPEPELRPLSG